MKNAKCTNCGAQLQVDEENDEGVCPYCNSIYKTESAIKMYTNSTTNNAGVINNYYNQPGKEQVQKVVQLQVEPRPQIKTGLAILGFIFYIIPGIIYIMYVKSKQAEWDKKYVYKPED